MKRCRQWTLLVAFTAASCLAGGVGNGQDDESVAQKPVEAQIQQAQKKRLNQQEKIQSLHKSMLELAKRRTELEKSKGKESNEVVALTAKMERIKRQAEELQKTAKSAAHSKSDSAAKKSAPAKVSGEVDQLLRKHGINVDHEDAQVRVRKGPNGETIVEIRKQDHADEHQRQVRVKADRLSLPPPVSVASGSARGDRPRSITVEGRPIEFARNRQSDIGPPNADGPGPMEAIRRLRVLEERLSQIERKLDAILERLGQRGPGSNNAKTDRRPRPQEAQQNRRRVNNDRPQDRPSPPDERARQRRQGPPDRDDVQMRRPQRPDAPPPPGRDEFAPPPRNDGPNSDSNNDRGPRPQEAQQDRRRVNNDRPQDRPPTPDERARQRRQGPTEGDDFQMRRPQRPDAPPPPRRDEFSPPPGSDGPDSNDDRMRRPPNPGEQPPRHDNEPPR